MTPKLFVITGPFGAGIPSLVEKILKKRSDLLTVTPVTARKMKPGEQDGVGFFFYDLEGWNALKEAGDLLETTELAGNDYGTSRRLVEEAFKEGKHVLLSVEPERAAQVKQNMPEAVCVYVEPSPAVLEARYREISRSEFELAVRLEAAEKERALSSFCDHRINSDDTDAAIRELNAIIA